MQIDINAKNINKETLESGVIEILTRAKDAIQKNMEDKGINATGNTSRSVRILKEGQSIMLVGGGYDGEFKGKTAPFETIEIGRPPGGDYKQLRAPIYYWTIAKGMDFESDSHRWAVATNISKNIVDFGTARHRTHEDVYSSVVKTTAEEVREFLKSQVRGAIDVATTEFNVETKTNF